MNEPDDTPQGWEGPLDTAIMFVDLVDSSAFSSVLGLKEYADYVNTFHSVVHRQCEHFFQRYLHGKYRQGQDYQYSILGDELVFFMHSGRSANDVYLLATLGITLKAAWLSSPVNRERITRRAAAAEIAVGINFGQVWARRTESGFERQGYAINLAKRIESHSRGGQFFRIFLSDAAYKQVHTRMRNLLFSEREFASGKGIVGQFGVYEIVDSFVDAVARLEPEIGVAFVELMEVAIDNSSRDLWIHSAFQVASESRHQKVTKQAADRCRSVLHYQTENAVALYYLAQYHREQKSLELAEITYARLLSAWPDFGDGHLEYGECLAAMGRNGDAAKAFLHAENLGVPEAVARRKAIGLLL
ncbi:MAG: adenylate/guanylate cyclase domain-containing protein [Verrucomicrobia bacterium]|nr:adenylate/guanylate cyclase domain-containing protein [Verrucomicrobiota bacterium]